MITVTITGPSGIGKTLLACYLRLTLRVAGINVKMDYNADAGQSLIGCADQLRRLNTLVAIVDRERQ